MILVEKNIHIKQTWQYKQKEMFVIKTIETYMHKKQQHKKNATFEENSQILICLYPDEHVMKQVTKLEIFFLFAYR